MTHGFIISLIASLILYVIAALVTWEANPDYWTSGEKFFVGLTGLLCLIVGPLVGWMVGRRRK